MHCLLISIIEDGRSWALVWYSVSSTTSVNNNDSIKLLLQVVSSFSFVRSALFNDVVVFVSFFCDYWIFNSPPAGMWSIVISMSVCLSLVYLRKHVQTWLNFLYTLPVAVAWSSSDNMATRYVLPVLYMTSHFLYIMALKWHQQTTAMSTLFLNQWIFYKILAVYLFYISNWCVEYFKPYLHVWLAGDSESDLMQYFNRIFAYIEKSIHDVKWICLFILQLCIISIMTMTCA